MNAWRRIGYFWGGALLLLSGAAAAGDSVGRDLFSGAVPLRGAIVGHGTALPPAATRCANCHAPVKVTPSGPASSAASFGPLLTRVYLTSSIARRGGPPSRYDTVAFCRLLRQGVDPAYVIVARAMPRYDISDEDCGALWKFLSDPAKP